MIMYFLVTSYCQLGANAPNLFSRLNSFIPNGLFYMNYLDLFNSNTKSILLVLFFFFFFFFFAVFVVFVTIFYSNSCPKCKQCRL